MNGETLTAEERLLDSATTDIERERLRILIDHQERRDKARQLELFIQGLHHLHVSEDIQLERLERCVTSFVYGVGALWLLALFGAPVLVILYRAVIQ